MNILFVCSGNTCRSAMAAAIADKIAQERDLDIRIESAGIFAFDGETASANAVEALKEYGIDLSYHRAKPVTKDLVSQSDVILAMTAQQKQVLKDLTGANVFTLTEYTDAEGDILDPYGGGQEAYDKTAEDLYGLITALADKLSEGK